MSKQNFVPPVRYCGGHGRPTHYGTRNGGMRQLSAPAKHGVFVRDNPVRSQQRLNLVRRARKHDPCPTSSQHKLQHQKARPSGCGINADLSTHHRPPPKNNRINYNDAGGMARPGEGEGEGGLRGGEAGQLRISHCCSVGP